MFYECEENNSASYADDTTSYSWESDTNTVISKLIFISNKIFHWFMYNHLTANPEKCHFLLSSRTPTDVSIGDASFTTRTKETLLGILIDSELSFDQHVFPFVVFLALCLLKNVEHQWKHLLSPNSIIVP